LLLQFLQ